MSKIHFITYGNVLYKQSKQRLLEEAKNSKWFHSAYSLGPENLSITFKNDFNSVLNKPRGAGYWIWKFDIIRQQLSKINKNDILIYLDAGCTINLNGEKRFIEYIEMLNNSDESVISFQLPHIERKYTTKELIQHFDMNENDMNSNSGQIIATVLIMKNNEKMLKIINECIDVLHKDPLLVTDHYNRTQSNYFIDNRHDQSILSLVRKKYGSIILSDETFFRDFGSKEAREYPFWATRRRN